MASWSVAITDGIADAEHLFPLQGLSCSWKNVQLALAASQQRSKAGFGISAVSSVGALGKYTHVTWEINSREMSTN